ncbi:hypothetical protein GIB67_000687 [Kingdonia uniflora]|uniref:Pentatricopeptide repeat-containing protein n=1 Tax=Kingdonia uniflora TaxID=39325 RepID=A0A7J7NDE4_9MAGN|nr:hypothetical protein GIB67_000687 [Kingdonia uniflora]
MSSKMSFLSKTHCTFFKTLKNPNSLRKISTFPYLSQEPQLEESSPSSSTPLPPNPLSGSPLYQENWRNPISNNPSSVGLAQSLVPLGLIQQAPAYRIQALSQTLDVSSLMDVFADWMTSQKWSDMKQLFEYWIRCLDKNGKPNKPNVNVYNHYLRANLMSSVTAGELLNLVAQMDDYEIAPNTASFNLVLKAMYQEQEADAAEKLMERMLQTGKESLPDDESYNLVIGLLFSTNHIDAALKYLDLTLKSGYMVSMAVFMECVKSCVNVGRLDTLTSIIERCKTMDQNKSLCPSWNLSKYIADVALLEANGKLAFFALEFLAKWMVHGEISRPPVFLSAEEGLVLSAIELASATYNPTLLDASWAILRRSLRQKRLPSPESYIGKINAHASLGNLQRAFSTLNEFESAYGHCTTGGQEDFFSPFTTLRPLVVACAKNGFETLDSVYFQLENLSRADPPYKSVAALNCVILGCANIWDLDRAYQTFEAISSTFGLTPDIHSYNALMCAFGKVKKTFEASRVFEHLTSLGVKPNETSYSMLVDAHLINKDPKAALSIIDEMVKAEFQPSKETLKKVKRRCVRELNYESNVRVDDLAKQLNIRLGIESRRNILFTLQYSSDYA